MIPPFLDLAKEARYSVKKGGYHQWKEKDLRHAIVAVVDEGLVGPEPYGRRPGAAHRGGPSVNRLGFAPAGIQTGEGKDARAQTGRRDARAVCGSIPRADTLAGVV